MNENLKLKRKKWYTNKNVQFELLRLMKDREVVFIDSLNRKNTIRGLRITSLQWLNDVFKNFGFFRKNYNMYISVAKYSKIPNFTIDLSNRSKETSEWFNKQAIKSVISYDFLHDFDCDILENYMKMKKEVQNLIDFYDKELITYSVFPTGNNFQVIVPSKVSDIKKFSKTRDDPETLNGYTFKYINTIIERFNFKYLDTKGIGTFNKVRKLPYSLVNDRVCLPLTYQWFKNFFTYDDVDSNIVLKDIKLGFRGHKFINGFGNNLDHKHFKDFTRQYFLD